MHGETDRLWYEINLPFFLKKKAGIITQEAKSSVFQFKVWYINPYKPSFLFVGHRQTVQTQIRHSAASDQGLHCLLTEYSFKMLIKMNKTTHQPFKRKWTGPIDKSEKFHSAYVG